MGSQSGARCPDCIALPLLSADFIIRMKSLALILSILFASLLFVETEVKAEDIDLEDSDDDGIPDDEDDDDDNDGIPDDEDDDDDGDGVLDEDEDDEDDGEDEEYNDEGDDEL